MTSENFAYSKHAIHNVVIWNKVLGVSVGVGRNDSCAVQRGCVENKAHTELGNTATPESLCIWYWINLVIMCSETMYWAEKVLSWWNAWEDFSSNPQMELKV